MSEHANTTHGGSRLPEYKIWKGMRYRCSNADQPGWQWYGGKGVKVCKRWQNDFAAFYEDMGPRPTKKHSLDRYPDRDGDYKPGNVRWATTKEQAANRNLPARSTYPRKRRK